MAELSRSACGRLGAANAPRNCPLRMSPEDRRREAASPPAVARHEAEPPEAGCKPRAARSRGIELEAMAVPTTGSQQQAIHDALRLLAVWAVRAARARVGASDST